MEKYILLLSAQQSLEYEASVPVNNYLFDPNEQNAPENFMGFFIVYETQPTVARQRKYCQK